MQLNEQLWSIVQESSRQIVASNVSSMQEIVGESALLVNSRDPKQLAQAVGKLLVDDKLNRSRRESGLSRAVEFSWERTARKTLQVYYQVCKA